MRRTITLLILTLAFISSAHAQFFGGGGSGTGGASGSYSTASVGYTTAAPYYFPPGGGAAASTTESAVQGLVSIAGSVNNFSANLSAAPGANTITFTWRKNGSDQAVTCSITGAATSCKDVTHNFAVAVNDLVDIKAVVTTGTVTAGVVFAWGTPGTPGPQGVSVTTTSEPSGPNCTYGGQKLVSASGTSYVCNGAPGGGGGSNILQITNISPATDPNAASTPGTAPGPTNLSAAVDANNGIWFYDGAKWQKLQMTVNTGPYTLSAFAGTVTTGLAASRPACSADSLYYATDTHVLSQCVGITTTWTTLNGSGYVAAIVDSTAGTIRTYDSSGNIFSMVKDVDCTGTGHVLKIIAGVGTCTADSGGGGGTLVIGGSMGGGTTIAASTSIAFMPFGNNQATLTAAYWTVPVTTSFTKFYVTPRSTGVSQSATGSVVCDFFVNDVEITAGPKITIAAGTTLPSNNLTPYSFSDTSHTLSVNAGDQMRMQCINNATAASISFNSWTLSQ